MAGWLRSAVQLALPGQSLSNDCFEIVEFRRPAKERFDALRACDKHGWIAWAPARDPHRERSSRDALDGLDHFENGKAVAVTAIANEALTAVALVLKGEKMGFNQVRDLNIVANTGPIPGRVIGAEDIYVRPQPQSRLHRCLNEMSRL